MSSAVPTMRRKIDKVVGIYPFTSGAAVPQQFDRDGILTQLNLQVSFTITNGGTAAVAPQAFALAQIIQEFTLTLNGKDTIIRQSGEHLAARAITDFGALPFGLDATVVLTASAATNYSINIPVALFLPNAKVPDDTGVETRNLSQVTGTIRFANANCQEIFGTPNGATISNVNAQIIATYTQTDESAIIPLSENMVRVLDTVSVNNIASNAQLGIQMDRGNWVYRGFKILTKRNGVYVDNIVNNLRVQSGSLVFTDMSASNNRAQLTNNYRLFSTAAIGALTGHYDHNYAQFGSLLTGINVSPDLMRSDLFHYLTTTFTSGSENIAVLREAVRRISV